MTQVPLNYVITIFFFYDSPAGKKKITHFNRLEK